jgi:glycosyltransferase involved in cell wall biosynthesis
MRSIEQEFRDKDAPRIALAPGSVDGGGIGTATLNLAEGLISCGAKVDLLLTSEPKDGRRIPEGVAVRVLGGRTRHAFGATRRYLCAARPDMVISARNYMHLLAAGALRTARVKGCTHVWTFHTHRTTELSRARPKDRLVDWLAIRAISTADRLVAVSRGVAEDLEQGTGLAPGSVTVIPNPAWHPRYLELAAAPCPHRWLEDGGPPVILGIGRLVPQKDFPTLIRAFARLEIPARLIILGEGAERAALEAMVRDLKLDERVRLPGHVPNIFAWLGRADLFVLSSRWEGFGMVLIEALGCGTPIVSTDCPSGPSDILNGGGTLGTLVPIGDPAVLASAISNCLTMPPRNIPPEVIALYRFEQAAHSYLTLCRPAVGLANVPAPI